MGSVRLSLRNKFEGLRRKKRSSAADGQIGPSAVPSNVVPSIEVPSGEQLPVKPPYASYIERPSAKPPSIQTSPAKEPAVQTLSPEPPPLGTASVELTPSSLQSPVLWGAAWNQLSREQQDDLRAISRQGESRTYRGYDNRYIVDDLITATRKKQAECERKFWRFNPTGKSGGDIFLRDKADIVISFLTKAGNVGVSFAPSLVQQIWPCFKGLMQIPVSEARQMTALLEVADKVAQAAARGRVFETCYTEANTCNKGAIDALHNTLTAMYKAALELLSTAVALLSKGLTKRSFYAVLHPDGIALSDFTDLETRLAWDAQAAQGAMSAQARNDIQHWLQSLDVPIARVDENVERILVSITREERNKIFDWVSAIPYGQNHDDVGRRVPGTCEWLLRDKRFKVWDKSCGCELLWLRGSTGLGKTFLVSKVIDYKKDVLANHPNDEGLAFFYFNRKNTSMVRDTKLSCLQSLVRQLATTHKNEGRIRPELQLLYQKLEPEKRSLREEDCKEQLTQSINLYSKTTIIIDALDECSSEDEWVELIDLFNELMRTCQRPLKVFISSRPEGRIIHALRNMAGLEIGMDDNQGDIAKLINEKLPSHYRWGKFNERTRSTVINILLEKSKGIPLTKRNRSKRFRWTALQIDALKKARTDEQILAKVKELPKTLEDTYEEMFLKYEGSDRAVISRAILWMLAAKGPQYSHILLPAIRIDPLNYVDAVLGSTKPDALPRELRDAENSSSEVTEDLLLDLCANLLTLDSKKAWQFCHPSVSDYFEKQHFRRLRPHIHISVINLARMIAHLPEEHDPRKDPLLWYAITLWMEHVMTVERFLGSDHVEDDDHCLANLHQLPTWKHLSAMLEAFLGHPNESSTAYRSWLKHYKFTRLGEDLDLAKWMAESKDQYASITMVRFGLCHILRNWWQSSRTCGANGKQAKIRPMMDLEILTHGGWNLFSLACYHEQSSSLKELLATGVDPNVKFDNPLCRGLHPIALACYSGNLEILELLTDRPGTDPNLSLRYSSLDYGSLPSNSLHSKSLLCLAARENHTEILRLLLAKGGRPDMPFEKAQDDSSFTAPKRSPLAHSARWNNIEAMKMLVTQGGADPNLPLPEDYDRCGTAAIVAAYYNNYDALEYLFTDGQVKVNAKINVGRFESAVAAAVIGGMENELRFTQRLDTLSCLARHRADFNVPLPENLRFNRPRSALERAVQEHPPDEALKAVEVLVKGNADINYQSGNGHHGCALVAALCWRRVFGLQGRSRVRSDPAAVQAILPYLIEKGADVNLQIRRGKYPSPLAAAAAQPGAEARQYIDYLIDNCANVNLELQHGIYGSALAMAAGEQSLESAQRLIDHGAKVNLRLTKGNYASAMIAAASRGRKDAVDLLIANGADPGLPENVGWERLLLHWNRHRADAEA